MPELIEVELYRRDLDCLVGQSVTGVSVRDTRAVRPKNAPPELFRALVGATLERTWRHGKLLVAEFDGLGGPIALGWRFGMTGRLLIDGESSIAQLEYSSPRDNPAWDRFELASTGGVVVLRDQRCFGSVELDPETTGLAPEASTVSRGELSAALSGRTKAVKAALLDQSIVAGLGNLLADEILWVAGVSPHTPVDEFSNDDIASLAGHIRSTVERLTAAGGSNTGISFGLRHAGATCLRCSGSMHRDRIGGRTAWWCPTHQG